MATVAVSDIATLLGRTITDPTEQDQIVAWIRQAEALIKVRLGPLENLDADAVKTVVEFAVVRHARNPDAITYSTIDDYSERRDSDAARPSIFITAEEWALLEPATADDRDAFTINTIPAAAQNRGAWW